MRYRLTLPRQILLGALPALLEGHAAWGVAAKSTLGKSDEFLLGKLDKGRAPPAGWGRGQDGWLPFLLKAGDAWVSGQAWQDWLEESAGIDSSMPLGIAVVTAEGNAAGWIRSDARHPWQALAEIRLPGAGMASTSLAVEENELQDESSEDNSQRFSRLAGALTPAVLSRLQGLNYAVIGVSRLGSLFSHGLVRLGCRHVILVDPDVVESHNADVGLFHPSLDEGRQKVAVIARDLRRLAAPGSRVKEFAQPLQAPLPFSAVREADVIVSCVDDDGARVMAALLAASHFRIHLDIGAGVLEADGGRRIAGADIRLILPEERPRCFSCFGGLARPGDLRRLAGMEAGPPPAWNAQRAGSLGSLNGIAVGLGLRLLERLVSGEVVRSTWMRYEDAPMPTLREITPRPPWDCPLCGTAWGIGDEIFRQMDTRLRRLARVLGESEGEASGR